MYKNIANNHNNTSFQYITPNSRYLLQTAFIKSRDLTEDFDRIVPSPSTAEYHVSMLTG
jgi:hypothetical protein